MPDKIDRIFRPILRGIQLLQIAVFIWGSYVYWFREPEARWQIMLTWTIIIMALIFFYSGKPSDKPYPGTENMKDI